MGLALALCATVLVSAIPRVGSGETKVALRVDDARGVSADEQTAILAAFSQAIAARSGQVAVTDAVVCKKKDRCVVEVTDRTQAESVVFLRMLGVPTRIRIIAEKIAAKESSASPVKKSAELDLPRAREGWSASLATLAESLFDAKALPAVVETPPISASASQHAAVTATVQPQPTESSALRELAPWIAAGGGAVALATGIGFGLSARGARNEASDPPGVSDQRYAELQDRADTHGLVANVCFVTAGLAAGTAVVLWLIED